MVWEAGQSGQTTERDANLLRLRVATYEEIKSCPSDSRILLLKLNLGNSI